MKVISPTFEIRTQISKNGYSELRAIEEVARECYCSQDKITEDGESARALVKSLIDRGHEAMLEHAPTVRVRFVVPRRIANELVRHRLASFAQQSTRYCNYSKDKFGSEITVVQPSCFFPGSRGYNRWVDSCQESEDAYLDLIGDGYTPQEASGVLPGDLAAPIHVTANLREWRTIFKLRTDISAHPEMRRMMRSLLAEFQQRIPIVFDDILVDEFDD